jgi:hypothetical protein
MMRKRSLRLFLDNLYLGDVPGPERKSGEFFPRLVGLRVSSDGNYEPIYIPRIRIHSQAGQILIEVNSNRPLAYITLQFRPPFLNFFRFQWQELEDE